MQHRGTWTNKWTFILATTGSAIGLGNIWKFPYMIGVNGGSAFVLIFLACILIVGIPLMMTEIMLGRSTQKNPINAIKTLAKKAGVSPHWKYIGAMGTLAGALILSFYSVVGGWVLSYIFSAAQGAFTNINASQSSAHFDALLADPKTLMLWHSIFMLITMSVVARGLNYGLEKANNILIPALFAILLVLLGYSLSVGDMNAAITFMFKPDFSKISPAVVLSALGHAFFSLSLGMGSVMVYGSYLKKDISIARTTIYIALFDTVLGLLVGLAIYSLVFANQLAPNAGPGLIFQTLPIAFGMMPWGNFIATLFFILVGFAAWTSSISLIEPTIAWVVESTNINRLKACFILGCLIWLIGVSVVLSFSTWKEVEIIFGLGIFDTLDKLTSTVLLPLGGLLMAIFAGYLMKNKTVQAELGLNDKYFKFWKIANNIVAPIAICAIFLYLFGIVA